MILNRLLFLIVISWCSIANMYGQKRYKYENRYPADELICIGRTYVMNNVHYKKKRDIKRLFKDTPKALNTYQKSVAMKTGGIIVIPIAAAGILPSYISLALGSRDNVAEWKRRGGLGLTASILGIMGGIVCIINSADKKYHAADYYNDAKSLTGKRSLNDKIILKVGGVDSGVGLALHF